MIRTERVSFHIGTFRLQDVCLEVTAGRYFVLLGPPGSGKSIFLECLCGLKKIDSGKIFIDGRDVTLLEPRARGIGYVPQDYALFPHLTVEQNIAFGLRVHKYSRGETARRVGEAADLLGIRQLLSRKVNGLSGGEAQRVALGRALVLQPKVLLLDEPVCALDEITRQEVCSQLSCIQRHLGLTVIHVSHNLEEAFSVADQAGILHQGVLQQVGTLEQLLRRPCSEFVARFMRCENVFCGQVTSVDIQQGRTKVKVDGAEISVAGEHSGRIKFMIRPEDVLIHPYSEGRGRGQNEICVKAVRWRNYGSYVKVELEGPIDLVSHLTEDVFAELRIEHRPDFLAVLRPDSIHVLPV